MPEESFFENPKTWVAVAFVIFTLLFGRKLFTALTGMLDKRADAVRVELAEAARLKREAEAMRAAAATSRAQALEDARALIDGARAEAARLTQTAREDAATAAERRERMAHDRIAAAEKAAVDEVRLTAVRVASVAAEQVIRTQFDAEADAALIDRAIGALPQALRAA